MKKLLCVLMFGMVFGQDAITTREYEIDFSSSMESIDILENINGNYEVKLSYFIPNDFPTLQGWGDCGIKFYTEFDPLVAYQSGSMGLYFRDNGSDGNNDGGVDDVSINGGIITINEIYPLISIGYFDAECLGEYNGTLGFRITGRFDDTDVGLQGDMNDDDSLDVIDVVMLVDVILSGGVGDVGDLINIVRG